jgi:hypothetical protein
MNQPPRSGNKILYIKDNQSSRPPLLQKEGKLFYEISHSSPKLRLTAVPPAPPSLHSGQTPAGGLQQGVPFSPKNNQYYIVCSKNAAISYLCLAAGCSIVAPFGFAQGRQGKSGQHRAPYFLTGKYLQGYSSVTEKNRPLRLRSGG